MNRSWNERKIKLNMKKYRQTMTKQKSRGLFLMKSKEMKMEERDAKRNTKRNAQYQRKFNR